MRTNRHFLLSASLFAVSLTVAAIGLGCGNASVAPFFPCVRGPSTDITFKGGVLPLFTSRNCTQNSGCHLGNPSATGQLVLAGTTSGGAVLTEQAIYDHLFVSSGYAANPFVTASDGFQVSAGATSAASLILLEPLDTNGPVNHPTTVWTGISDPGYVTIAKWIQAGGYNNGPEPLPTCEPDGGATPQP
jgi:hypothetical protein